MTRRIPEIGANCTARWVVPKSWALPTRGTKRKVKGLYLGDDGMGAHIIYDGQRLRYVPDETVTFTIHRRG